MFYFYPRKRQEMLRKRKKHAEPDKLWIQASPRVEIPRFPHFPRVVSVIERVARRARSAKSSFGAMYSSGVAEWLTTTVRPSPFVWTVPLRRRIIASND